MRSGEWPRRWQHCNFPVQKVGYQNGGDIFVIVILFCFLFMFWFCFAKIQNLHLLFVQCNVTVGEPYRWLLRKLEMTAPAVAGAQDVCASDPNFAVIFAFCERFGDSCGVTIPTFQELQEMLENTDQGKARLVKDNCV